MSDSDDTPRTPPDPQEFPAGGFSLGGLAAGDADTTLGRRNEPPPPEVAPAGDSLILPRGALVTLRKSGGLRFSSRVCVVYRNGRVERADLASGPARPVYLSQNELQRLRHLLLRSRLASWVHIWGSPSPDAYSYEIAARFGHNIRRVELHDGGIPNAIEPLARSLSQLLP